MSSTAQYGTIETSHPASQAEEAPQGGENSPASDTRKVWRSASTKVRAAQGFSRHSKKRKKWQHARGTEPGLDPHRAIAEGEVDALGVSCDVVDLSSDRVELRRAIDSRSLKAFISKERPGWSKCRWINVNGASWTILRELGLRYELHPLALEDALHTRNSRSKCDYYKNHIFLKVLLHELDLGPPPDESSPRPSSPTGSIRSLRKADLESNTSRTRTLASADDQSSLLGKNTDLPLEQTDSALGHQAMRKAIEEMTRQYRVRLAVQQLSVFLLKDGTLITCFEHDSSTTLAPIFERIRQDDTVLRSSQDVGMLLQAVLDVAVDELIEIVEAFRKQLTLLEGRVLIQAEMESVRHLHVLSGDLLLLKRALTPIHTLISTLRHHDSERSHIASGSSAPPSATYRSSTHGHLSIESDEGYLSQKTKVYLADVLDHLDSVLSSLELFSGLADKLEDYSFQSLAFSQNESMKGLSVVTTVFLPLTFLTGYYGMNFTGFDQIEGPVERFWYLALPCSAACIAIFCFSYFFNVYKAVSRRIAHYRHARRHGVKTSEAARLSSHS